MLRHTDCCQKDDCSYSLIQFADASILKSVTFHFKWNLLLIPWFLVYNFYLHRASGTVYTALDIATGQEVSVLLVLSDFLFDASLKKRSVLKMSQEGSLFVTGRERGVWIYGTEKEHSNIKKWYVSPSYANKYVCV